MSDRTFDIASVVEHTFGAIGRNFPVFFGLAFLLNGLPTMAVHWGQRSDNSGVAILAVALGTVVNLVTAYVLQSALVHGTVADLNGRRADLGQSLAVGARMFLPVLGISILFGLAIALGIVLLIFPGLIVMTLWLVAVPAQVIEKTGVFGSFTRSRNLTRGHRWPVFGLLVIYFIVGLISLVVVGGLSIPLGNAGFAGAGVAIAVVAGVGQAFSNMIGAVGVAAVYYELRRIKEGVGPEALAAVFA